MVADYVRLSFCLSVFGWLVASASKNNIRVWTHGRTLHNAIIKNLFKHNKKRNLDILVVKMLDKGAGLS